MIRTNDVAKLLSNLQGVKNGFEKKKNHYKKLLTIGCKYGKKVRRERK